jgi:hypothetical protein
VSCQIRQMITLTLRRPILPRVLCASLLCVLTLSGIHPAAHAAETTRPSPSSALTTQQFFCSAGYDRESCLQHTAQLRAVLRHYPAAQHGPWSWVIVRSEDWGPFLLRLHLDQRSPAFTALEQRSTFLEEVLFHPKPERAAELEKTFATPLPQLLAAAVTHELAHAVCHEMDETAANRIAEQLRAGGIADCSLARGLTPIQELGLHRNSPRLRP